MGGQNVLVQGLVGPRGRNQRGELAYEVNVPPTPKNALGGDVVTRTLEPAPA
jgi:hypothetical protein